MLAVVAAVVFTGLFSGGEDASGPFAGVGGLELSEVHELLFRVLQGLVAVHLLGVLIESLKAKDALVPAMITGNKARREDEPGVDAKRASLAALVVALSAGALSSAWLIVQAPASPGASERDFSSGYEDHERRHDDD